MDTIGRSYSVRRKSGVLGLRRQTYYARKRGFRPEEEDNRIAEQLHRLTKQFVAWGFWLVFYCLRNEGFRWNHKRVYRVWKQESLHLRKLPKRPKIKRIYQDLLAPEQVNEGWAMDFLSEWVIGEEQQKVRIINIMDECSRKALWTEAKESLPANALVDILDQVVAWRGAPAYIRCDNGPEFISEKLANWAKDNKVELRFIQPGKPTQNGLIERLNGTLRTECLNLEWFENLEYLNEKLQDWWHTYNFVRPHSAINHQTPDEKEQSTLYFKPVAA